MLLIVAVFLSTLTGTLGSTQRFPHGFKFGAATSSYQIEGAWNVSDKSESIWDRVVHSQPNKVAGKTNGDVACDSYHQWRRDVEMVHKMGLHFYRFSISWTRLLPNAFVTKVSESGKKYYNDLINYLLEKGIEPVITLYHWDLPQKLQDLGGWTNPLISDWYADYARVVFSLFADRVKTWITFNEPLNMCDINYNLAFLAPAIQEPEMAGLLCNKHILVSHAKAWRIYDKEYKPMYHGKLSIANHIVWMEPKNKGDEEITELAMQSCAGQYSHPIYSKQGGWPPAVERAMAAYSKKAGYARSKLPAFTKEEILLVKGTYDFYGLNYYTGRQVRRAVPGDNPGIWPISGRPEFDIILETDPSWKVMGSEIAPTYPEGMRKLIAWLKKQYGDIEFLITENGCDDPKLNDHTRMKYIKSHLEQILLSIYEDGANITGYTYWTLMDNFEWFDGFTKKFGLYGVNFDHPKRVRYPRTSVYYYSNIVKRHSLDVSFPKEQPLRNTYQGAVNSSTRKKENWSKLNYFLGSSLVFLYLRPGLHL